MNKFIHTLYDGPLDIIGDIHGELPALCSLIKSLGYDSDGNHPDDRRLVFVGDLVDRGLNSIGVVRLVKKLIDNGKAQCIIGNHELNILMGSRREGNGWFFGSPHGDDQKIFKSVVADSEDRKFVLDFFNSLPIALESDKLRIVHACWDQSSIDTLKCINDADKNIKSVYDDYTNRATDYIKSSGIYEGYRDEQKKYSKLLRDKKSDIPFLENTAKYDYMFQAMNPIRVITSGIEAAVDQPFYTGGKWRMVDRLAWWDLYQSDIPVVIGHYWRNFKSVDEKDGLFKHIDSLHWFGCHQNIFCVDYSVGRRYVDRAVNRPHSSKLHALRFPENILMSEDGDILITTTHGINYE